MITGVVRNGEARVRLKIRGGSGREQDLEGVIDTGYTAFLSLPPAVVSGLGFTWLGIGRGVSDPGGA